MRCSGPRRLDPRKFYSIVAKHGTPPAIVATLHAPRDYPELADFTAKLAGTPSHSSPMTHDSPECSAPPRFISFVKARQPNMDFPRQQSRLSRPKCTMSEDFKASHASNDAGVRGKSLTNPRAAGGRGRLRPGARLPSERDLDAQQLGVGRAPQCASACAPCQVLPRGPLLKNLPQGAAPRAALHRPARLGAVVISRPFCRTCIKLGRITTEQFTERHRASPNKVVPAAWRAADRVTSPAPRPQTFEARPERASARDYVSRGTGSPGIPPDPKPWQRASTPS